MGISDFASLSSCAVCLAFMTSSLSAIFRKSQTPLTICCDSCPTVSGSLAIQNARLIIVTWLLVSWAVSWRHGPRAGLDVLVVTAGIALLFYEEVTFYDNYMINWFLLPFLVGVAYMLLALLGLKYDADALSGVGFCVISMLACMGLTICSVNSLKAAQTTPPLTVSTPLPAGL